MRLILFDIDGTLLRCGRQVAEVFLSCLREVYGTVGDLEGYSFAGRTDPGIVLDLMTAAGVEQESVVAGLPRMRRLYLDRLEQSLDLSEMRLLPGVIRLLENLETQGEITLGLLTGNWQGGARTKLGRFGLNRFFSFGAFGDDGFVRQDLLPQAWSRARQETGCSFDREETLLVGDSVLDVDCGRAHGAPVLAVTTGSTTAEDLAAAGAHWVFPNLPAATERILAFMARGPKR